MKIERNEDKPKPPSLADLQAAQYTIELTGLELLVLRKLARKVWGSKTCTFRKYTNALAEDPIPGLPDVGDAFFDVTCSIGACSLPAELR